jgi:hypothetical protein
MPPTRFQTAVGFSPEYEDTTLGSSMNICFISRKMCKNSVSPFYIIILLTFLLLLLFFALVGFSLGPVDDVAELAIAGGTAQQVRRGRPLRHHQGDLLHITITNVV